MKPTIIYTTLSFLAAYAAAQNGLGSGPVPAPPQENMPRNQQQPQPQAQQQQPPQQSTQRASNTSSSSGCVSKRYDFTDATFLNDFEREAGEFEIYNGTLTLKMTADQQGGRPVGNLVNFRSKFDMQYGRFAARMKAPPLRGSVSYLMAIADNDDEIDIEFTGGNLQAFQSNVFDAQKVYGANGRLHDVGSDISQTWNDYEVIWSEAEITWIVNGQVVRRRARGGQDMGGDRVPGVGATGNGASVYPTAAAHLALGAWDTVKTGEQGTIQWAGEWQPNWVKDGVPFEFDWLEFQCQDDYVNNRPAKKVDPDTPSSERITEMPKPKSGAQNQNNSNSAAAGSSAGVLSVIAASVGAVLYTLL